MMGHGVCPDVDTSRLFSLAVLAYVNSVERQAAVGNEVAGLFQEERFTGLYKHKDRRLTLNQQQETAHFPTHPI